MKDKKLTGLVGCGPHVGGPPNKHLLFCCPTFVLTNVGVRGLRENDEEG